MTERKKIKYGTLLVLGLIILSLNIHFGDFCEGMAKGLLFVLLSAIFILCFLIIELRDLYKLINKKEKFDFIPLSFLVILIASSWFFIVANENKFWREIKYEGVIENGNARKWIVFYENNSFEATISHVENRCTFVGKYHIENNIIILDDKNIESKTDENFTKKYLIIADTVLQPLDKKYRRIQLKSLQVE